MQNLRYPLQRLESNSDYLAINIIEYNPPGIGSGGGIFNIKSGSSVNNSKVRVPIGRIFLPIPEGLNDNNSVQWNSDSLNGLQAASVDVLDGIIKDMNLKELTADPMGTLQNTAGNVLTKLGDAYSGLKDENTKNILRQYFAVQAANVFNANIDPNSVLGRTTGQVLNPNLELLFKGVNLRMFTFTFTMTPRSPQEGEVVKGIIKTFKRRMAPKNSVGTAARGLFIKSPDVFELQFRTGNKPHPFLFKLKTCALKDMRVSYSNAGPYATYEDGTPVSMTMTLTFQEINPIYQGDYDDNDPGVGF